MRIRDTTCQWAQRFQQTHSALVSFSTIPLRLRSCRQRCPAIQAEPKIVRDSPSSSVRIFYKDDSYPNAVGVEGLLTKVGWPASRRHRMELATQNSYYVGTLEAQRGSEACQLIGLARVVSDGVLNAQLWDIVVDPEYQSMGLGEVLVAEVVQSLVQRGISNITTFAEKPSTKFFEKLGFQVDPDGVRAMIWRAR